MALDQDFADRLTANIKSNRIRLIVAADRLPAELRTVIEVLNEASTFDLLGLEVRLFRAGPESPRVLATELIGATERSRGEKPGRPTSRRDKERFFAALEESYPPRVVSLAEHLLQFTQALTDRGVQWGTGRERGSFTARLVIGDNRHSLLSVYMTES